MAGRASRSRAVGQPELARGKEVHASQHRFAKVALASGKSRRGEIAPWIERCGQGPRCGYSACACDAPREVIGAELRRPALLGERTAKGIELLRHKELAFEILDLFELRGGGRGRCLLVS